MARNARFCHDGVMSEGTGVLVIADDLSGACETAAVFGGMPVLLPGHRGELPRNCAVDLGTRERPAVEHTEVLRRVLAAKATGCLFIKTDSVLRGHLRETLGEIVELGRPVLFSPALPEHGRHVREETLLVGGVPLDQTDLWARESRPAPTSFHELLGDIPHVIVDPHCDGVPLRRGMVTICDLKSAGHAAVLAKHAVGTGAVLVGASALARGLAAGMPRIMPAGVGRVMASRRILVAVGSAADAAIRQRGLLSEVAGIDPFLLSVDRCDQPVDQAGLANLSIVGFEKPDRLRPEDGPLLLKRLSRVVAESDLRSPADLVLIGGDTADAVLAELGITRLDVLHEVHPGAVISVAGDRLVATRPGSFGDDSSLLQIIEAMKDART